MPPTRSAEPATTALPDYEINQQLALLISFEADAPGGYDLRLGLDDKLHSLTNSLTLSVIAPWRRAVPGRSAFGN